uniref:Uncharacterized protein n=1 Tax=Anguilla anguilla TaxID=7936 RepID=A0A0E9U1Q1_ANGAN
MKQPHSSLELFFFQSLLD